MYLKCILADSQHIDLQTMLLMQLNFSRHLLLAPKYFPRITSAIWMAFFFNKVSPQCDMFWPCTTKPLQNSLVKLNKLFFPFFFLFHKIWIPHTPLKKSSTLCLLEFSLNNAVNFCSDVPFSCDLKTFTLSSKVNTIVFDII